MANTSRYWNGYLFLGAFLDKRVGDIVSGIGSKSAVTVHGHQAVVHSLAGAKGTGTVNHRTKLLQAVL